MAQLLLEPFTGYAYADITQVFSSADDATGGNADAFSTSSPPRASAQYLAMRLSAGGGNKSGKRYVINPQYPLPTGNVVIFGFRFRSSSFSLLFQSTTAGNGNATFFLYHIGVVQMWGKFNSDGTMSFYRGTTLLGTTSIAISVNVWTYLEFKITVRTGTNGSIDVRMNGLTSILSLSGINTAADGSDGWTGWTLPWLNANGFDAASVGFDVMDVYLADGSGATWNNFMGDMRVDLCHVNGVGNSNMSTPSTGTDRSLTVDEASANGDTDYNTLAAVNDKDTYAMENVPVAGATILGVETRMQIRKSDAGSAGVKHVVRVNGTDYLGSENGVFSSYTIVRQQWSVNPATGVAWVDTGTNGWNGAETGLIKST